MVLGDVAVVAPVLVLWLVGVVLVVVLGVVALELVVNVDVTGPGAVIEPLEGERQRLGAGPRFEFERCGEPGVFCGP